MLEPRFDTEVAITYAAGATPEETGFMGRRVKRALEEAGFTGVGGGWIGAPKSPQPDAPHGKLRDRFIRGDVSKVNEALRLNGLGGLVTVEVVKNSMRADLAAQRAIEAWRGTPGNLEYLSEKARSVAAQLAKEMEDAGVGFDTGVITVEAEEAIRGGAERLIGYIFDRYYVDDADVIVSDAILMGPDGSGPAEEEEEEDEYGSPSPFNR